MFIYIKNKLKEKKGLNSIEMVIGSLIVIALFAGMTDFIKISNRMQSLSSTMTYVSRVLSNQGCLANSPESIYLDSSGRQLYNIDYIKNKKFVRSDTFFNNISEIMKSDGIKDDEWRVFINGERLTSSTTTKLFDFRERIPVKIEIDYTWGTLSDILPINEKTLGGTFKTSQEIVSTYKVRELGEDQGFEYKE